MEPRLVLSRVEDVGREVVEEAQEVLQKGKMHLPVKRLKAFEWTHQRSVAYHQEVLNERVLFDGLIDSECFGKQSLAQMPTNCVDFPHKNAEKSNNPLAGSRNEELESFFRLSTHFLTHFISGRLEVASTS